jgi:hypothetical protein
MDQNMKLKELEQARHRVVEGERTLSCQREVVAKLEAKGYDATVARQLFASIERIQALKVNEVDRMEKELANQSNNDQILQPNRI